MPFEVALRLPWFSDLTASELQGLGLLEATMLDERVNTPPDVARTGDDKHDRPQDAP
jgi:hypothetical protein